MRTRKLVTALTTLSIALAITACSGKGNNGTDINTTTEQQHIRLHRKQLSQYRHLYEHR